MLRNAGLGCQQLSTHAPIQRRFEDHLCHRAVQVFVHRLRKYLGAYLVHLKGKVDAVIWSAGIGENSALVRRRALADLQVRVHRQSPCQTSTAVG